MAGRNHFGPEGEYMDDTTLKIAAAGLCHDIGWIVLRSPPNN